MHCAPTPRTHTHCIPNQEIMQKTVKVNKIDIYVETFGNSTHPAVLLIMGLGCQCLNWFSYFYEPIVEQGYYVIRFDNRDNGRCWTRYPRRNLRSP
jgi:pimeloyl-ACP methyl ester carboxylesterase